ncbi:hypothetical protein LXL04_034764 [Taraxacum kok-saghyz]
MVVLPIVGTTARKPNTSNAQYVCAQTNCEDVIAKLITCDVFMFGYLPKPNPQCCASAQDLVQAANASKDVLRATCRCLTTMVQSFPVGISNAAHITSMCHLNLNRKYKQIQVYTHPYTSNKYTIAKWHNPKYAKWQ